MRLQNKRVINLNENIDIIVSVAHTFIREAYLERDYDRKIKKLFYVHQKIGNLFREVKYKMNQDVEDRFNAIDTKLDEVSEEISKVDILEELKVLNNNVLMAINEIRDFDKKLDLILKEKDIDEKITRDESKEEVFLEKKTEKRI